MCSYVRNDALVVFILFCTMDSTMDSVNEEKQELKTAEQKVTKIRKRVKGKKVKEETKKEEKEETKKEEEKEEKEETKKEKKKKKRIRLTSKMIRKRSIRGYPWAAWTGRGPHAAATMAQKYDKLCEIVANDLYDKNANNKREDVEFKITNNPVKTEVFRYPCNFDIQLIAKV